jgi:hypothetical protein
MFKPREVVGNDPEKPIKLSLVQSLHCPNISSASGRVALHRVAALWTNEEESWSQFLQDSMISLGMLDVLV